MDVYNLLAQPGKKFVLLIDPDKYHVQSLIATVYAAQDSGVDLILVGGSLVTDRIDQTIDTIKKNIDVPVVLFPGSLMQLSDKADAILLISLISGRNPDYLIGNHVLAAPYLKKANIEIIPTGYILVGEGNGTSVEYISNTRPIPAEKHDLVVATAVAGEMLGNKLIYLESGSGASTSVSADLVHEVKRNISVPLIVGGGLRHASQIKELTNAGADILVVGNAVERDVKTLDNLVRAVH